MYSQPSAADARIVRQPGAARRRPASGAGQDYTRGGGISGGESTDSGTRTARTTPTQRTTTPTLTGAAATGITVGAHGPDVQPAGAHGNGHVLCDLPLGIARALPVAGVRLVSAFIAIAVSQPSGVRVVHAKPLSINASWPSAKARSKDTRRRGTGLIIQQTESGREVRRTPSRWSRGARRHSPGMVPAQNRPGDVLHDVHRAGTGQQAAAQTMQAFPPTCRSAC